MKTKSRSKVHGPGQRNGRFEKPAWDVAMLFPNQGHWSEDDYLGLDGNHRVELSDGHLEVLAMPTTSHQWIVWNFLARLQGFAYPRWGVVLAGPLPVRLWLGKIREPDVVFMLKSVRGRIREDYWEGADLAMEVVSGGVGSRRRDLVVKRAEYARAGIAEYWIIDPKLKQITILGLRGKSYELLGRYKKGDRAASRLLPGFAVEVAGIFAKP